MPCSRLTVTALFLGALLFLGGCKNPADPKPEPEPDAPTITAVALDRTSAEAGNGDTVEFQVAVTVEGEISTAVTWSVSGNNEADTTIAATTDTRATLTVGAYETAEQLTVTVTATADASKKATATVTVVRSVPPTAKAWYVSAEDGDDDENNGLSKDSPLLSFSAALEAIKTAYAADWPGKGMENEARAYIAIDGEITENMGGAGSTIQNYSSFIISSAEGVSDYPPIEIWGWNSERPGTLKAWNNKRVLYVDYNAVILGPYLTLTGANITGANNTQGAGLYVGNGGAVILNGAEIKDNQTAANGGGAYTVGTAAAPAVFTMERGLIAENQATGSGKGGGVSIGAGSTFILKSGEIKDNTAADSGGGVYLVGAADNRSVFNMEDGEIRGNKAGPLYDSSCGGGLYIGTYADFKMTGGTITGNSVQNNNVTESFSYYGGAGVYVDMTGTYSDTEKGTFRMGGAARITADNEVLLTANPFAGYPSASITICEPFTDSPSGPVAKIDLAGGPESMERTTEQRWNFVTIFAWDTGLSGAFPLDRFTLGNFQTGIVEDFTHPISPGYYVDANTGIIRAQNVTVTNIAISILGGESLPLSSLNQGAYARLTAVVTGEGNPLQDVTWSINSTKSQLVDKGYTSPEWYLLVGAEEDKAALTVSVFSAMPGITHEPFSTTLVIPPLHASGQRAWYVSAGGNDDNHGQTPEHSLASVEKALEKVKNVYRTTYNRDEWPKDEGGSEIPARIVISGEVTTRATPMATGQALAIARTNPTLPKMYPTLYFAGAGPESAGTLRVGPVNTRAFWVRYYDVILGANLTITGAAITSMQGLSDQNNGGAVYVGNGGVVTLDGAAITGNSTSLQGGGVFVGDNQYSVTDRNYLPARFIFKSGSITGNTAAKGGGGVSVFYGGIVEMTGGTLTGNNAAVEPQTLANGGKDLRMNYSEYTQTGVSTARAVGVFKIGGSAQVGHVQLQSSQSEVMVGPTNYRGLVTITLLGNLPGSGAVIQTIDLASLLKSDQTGANDINHVDLWMAYPSTVGRQVAQPVLTWDTGLSGSLPVGRFSLGNAINGTVASASSAAGAVTPLTGYHIDAASGVLTADTP